MRGEVYAVDEGKLRELDVLENHPNFYVREKQTVQLEESGEKLEVWVSDLI